MSGLLASRTFDASKAELASSQRCKIGKPTWAVGTKKAIKLGYMFDRSIILNGISSFIDVSVSWPK